MTIFKNIINCIIKDDDFCVFMFIVLVGMPWLFGVIVSTCHLGMKGFSLFYLFLPVIIPLGTSISMVILLVIICEMLELLPGIKDTILKKCN